MHGATEARGSTVQGPPPAPSGITMEDLLKPTGGDVLTVRYGSVVVPKGLSKEFEAAQRYLGTSQEAVNSLHDLQSGTRPLYIVRAEKSDFYNPKTNQLFWKPDSALVTTDGTTQTPANGLLHEQGHANEYKRDPEHFNQQSAVLDKHYGNAEERRNIGWEAKYSRELGEGVRSDHGGVNFTTKGPTDRDPAGVQAIADPELQREMIGIRVESLAKHGYPPTAPHPGEGEGEIAITKWDGKAHSGPVLHLNAATVAQYVADGKGGAYQIYDVQKDLKGQIPPMNHPHLTIDHEGKFPPVTSHEPVGRNL